MTGKRLFAERALLPRGWAEAVTIDVDARGYIRQVAEGAGPDGAEHVSGPLLPGMPNLHSHAFQRAMAGLAERAGPGEDSFWTWREVMYGFVARLDPDQVEAIAAQLYVEMLKAGFTAVGEFHYLHHGPDGTPYKDPAEMSHRIVRAATRSGIGLTLLPVLYAGGDFGGTPARPEQRRFTHEVPGFLDLLSRLFSAYADSAQVRVGFAPHSLRAVPPEVLRSTLEGLDDLDAEVPVHLHIAEQQKEVQDCIDWCGQRPVEWLLGSFDVAPRWCLVHATHITDEEARRLAGSGAVAGLCPTTEANLGDGVFPARTYLEAGGRFGIGSDSHVSVSPIEELRWLEYGQRLTTRTRNVLGGPDNAAVGAALFRQALLGGAQALGRPIGRLAEGARADLIVVDPGRPALVGRVGDELLNALVFAGNENPVSDVMVGGDWVVKEGRHREEADVFRAYGKTLASLIK